MRSHSAPHVLFYHTHTSNSLIAFQMQGGHQVLARVTHKSEGKLLVATKQSSSNIKAAGSCKAKCDRPEMDVVYADCVSRISDEFQSDHRNNFHTLLGSCTSIVMVLQRLVRSWRAERTGCFHGKSVGGGTVASQSQARSSEEASPNLRAEV